MQSDKKVIRLLLVRHGQTQDNKTKTISGHKNGKLTTHGANQAQKIGQYFKKQKKIFDQIFVSDLGRTKQTFNNASIKYPYLKQAKVQFTPMVRQRSGGILQGKSLSSWVQNSRKQGKNIREYKCEGAQSWIDVNKRASKFLQQLVTNHLIHGKGTKPQCKVLVVTHGGFIMEFRNVVSRIHKQAEKFDNTAKNCSMHEFVISFKNSKESQYKQSNVQIEQVISNFIGHL